MPNGPLRRMPDRHGGDSDAGRRPGADLFGSRRVFLTSLLLFTAGLATDEPVLRALQCLGAALLSPAALALQSRVQWSPLDTGPAFLPAALGTLISAYLSDNLVPQVGGRSIAVVAFSLAATGFALAALLLDKVVVSLAGNAIAAFGLGGAFLTSTTTALSHVEHRGAGVVSRLVNTLHEMCGPLGVAAVSAIAAASLASPRSRPASSRPSVSPPRSRW